MSTVLYNPMERLSQPQRTCNLYILWQSCAFLSLKPICRGNEMLTNKFITLNYLSKSVTNSIFSISPSGLLSYNCHTALFLFPDWTSQEISDCIWCQCWKEVDSKLPSLLVCVTKIWLCDYYEKTNTKGHYPANSHWELLPPTAISGMTWEGCKEAEKENLVCRWGSFCRYSCIFREEVRACAWNSVWTRSGSSKNGNSYPYSPPLLLHAVSQGPKFLQTYYRHVLI